MCDLCNELVYEPEKAARIFRVMTTYLHLAEAYDAFAEELNREISLVTDLGETPIVCKDTIDATQRVLNEIGAVRDGFARLVTALAGENRFKTGEIHRLYEKAMDVFNDPNADTDMIAIAILALLPPH